MFASGGSTGGFSPGRTFGPVVGTLGEGAGLLLSGAVLLATIGGLGEDGGDIDGLPPSALSVQPATAIASAATAAHSPLRTGEFSHDPDHGARVVHRHHNDSAPAPGGSLARLGALTRR